MEGTPDDESNPLALTSKRSLDLTNLVLSDPSNFKSLFDVEMSIINDSDLIFFLRFENQSRMKIYGALITFQK